MKNIILVALVTLSLVANGQNKKSKSIVKGKMESVTEKKQLFIRYLQDCLVIRIQQISHGEQ